MSENQEPRPFDVDDPDLPEWIRDGALTSDNFPYQERLKNRHYNDQLEKLQIELVKLQSHLLESGKRVVILFEGRDAAGKGGSIKAYREHLNPRNTRLVALPKPNDSERTQWYFQRYVAHLPAAGETVLFDRSWYNRAGVEPVLGFCTSAQTDQFFNEVPQFEEMLVDDGIHLFKFWLNIGHETQLKRFHARRHNPLKIWKLSPVDRKSLQMWDEYTSARDRMFDRTHTALAPWTVIRTNDKRRGRLNLIRTVLTDLDYPQKDEEEIGELDPLIAMPADRFLAGTG